MKLNISPYNKKMYAPNNDFGQMKHIHLKTKGYLNFERFYIYILKIGSDCRKSASEFSVEHKQKDKKIIEGEYNWIKAWDQDIKHINFHGNLSN